MSSDAIHIKELVIKGLHNILLSYNFNGLNLKCYKPCQYPSNVKDPTTKNCSKSVKSFVELSLTNDIKNLVDKISHEENKALKIDAHNLAKTILEESNLTFVQDNLKNIIDSCVLISQQSNAKQLNDSSEIDISPLLQPEHVSEIADCISTENPIDIRLNAFRVLLKSHVSDVVNEGTWSVLQKKLVENLCDSNVDVFFACLKVHAKLGTCTSPLAVKECTLNILDSLGRHYLLHYNDSKVISFQSIYFYRIVHLSRLALDTFREAILSVARFGESRLEEIVDNFFHLMTIYVPSKGARNKPCLSPVEVVSYLDPRANWFKNFFHNALTRKLVFSCISKNITFLRICVVEILHWANEPVIPSKDDSKVLHGEINLVIHKFSMFCHSLSVISTVCSVSASSTLFPLKINKQEEISRLENLLELLITLLNNQRFVNMMKNKASIFFVDLFTRSIAKLLSTKYVDSSSMLANLLSTSSDKNPLENPIKLKIFNILFHNDNWNNALIGSIFANRKHSSLSSLAKLKINNELLGNTKLDLESQSLVNVSEESDSKDLLPLELFLKQVSEELTFLQINNSPPLLKIASKILRRYDGTINCPYIFQVVFLVCKMYIKLINSLKNLSLKIKNDDILIIECCEEFLLQAATTSLGFHYLNKWGVVASLFLSKLHHPITNWSDNVYLMFVTKAASTDEGSLALHKESNGVLRNYFDNLWNSLEDNCSESGMSVETAAKSFYKIVAYLCINVKGLKALLGDLNEGSEVTLTDDHDVKPNNLFTLIQHLALNTENCLDFIFHEISLATLEILVSNIDSRLYLQHKFKYQDVLLQLQSDSRVDENSGVIVDECSILRQRIIDRSFLPNRFKLHTVPSHLAPRPESTFSHTRSRSRGNGDLARSLSESRSGLHDHNWIKHVRKLYKNSSADDVIKGAMIMDLLDQVVKVIPNNNNVPIKWPNHVISDLELQPEEVVGIQLVVRYGIHLRLIQSSQQNSENLKHLIQLIKIFFDDRKSEFERFDWFVATVYIVCSGNIEKTQMFLSSFASLPNGTIIWYRLRNEHAYAQLGSALEMIISEEMPTLCQVLLREGLSWWNLCSLWIDQCWWNVLEWPQICHWLVISILYPIDHIIYFCAAILHANHDRILQLAHLGTIYKIILNPVEKFNFSEAKHLMEKLHKKYHISVQHCLT